MTIPEIPKQLIENIKKDNLVIFVGAGLSINAGYPNWKELTITILNELKEKEPKTEGYIDALRKDLFEPIEILGKIEHLKTFAIEALEKEIKNHNTHYGKQTHEKIGQISTRIITTNYDKLLEKYNPTFEVVAHSNDYKVSKMSGYDKYIFKLHGDIDEPNKCILFPSDYEKLYSKEEKSSVFELKKTLSDKCILFVGFSLNDPYINNIKNYVSNLYSGYTPEHFIITTEAKHNLGDRITPIILDNHNLLESVLDKLISCKRTSPPDINIEISEKPIPEIKSSFKLYLNDIEAQFSHSKVDNLKLDDIYIAPDLRILNDTKKSNSYKTENLDIKCSAIDLEGIKFVLLGNDSSGKTAACKYVFNKYFDLGLYPILVNGSEINDNLRIEYLIKVIENKIKEQYSTPFRLTEISEKEKILIIIDDFHKSTKGKNKFWPVLIKNLEKEFSNIILTGNSLMPIENLNKQDTFNNFKMYSLLEFGPKFRFELANKWNTLGIETRFLDQNDLLRKNDAATAQMKSIIGKNYIPSYPFYLLSILQALESGNIQNPNYSIHGFYYEVLINECFSKAIKDKKEISLYYNYLTHFCFHLFELGSREVSIDGFEDFHNFYCEKHDLTYKKETILEAFDNAKLLYVNGKVFIKEKYVYYFFVAKYIANEIGNKKEIREIVSKMSLRVFRDEYSSIIMFVTHLSKDGFIINELINNANSIFADSSVSRLQEDISSINQLIDSIPEQVLKLVDVKETREDELEDEEETERLEKELEDSPANYDSFNLEDDISTIDFYAKINLALKTIDILGQVAKKHWGEIDGDQKYQLVIATYNLGLRTLNFYIQLIQKNSNEIVEHIERLIKAKHIKDRHSLKQNIKEVAQDFVFRLCFMTTFGITKRISNSIGYDKLKNSFQRALQSQPYNSTKLIDLSIKLGYSSIQSQIDLINEHKNNMEQNKLSMMVLQNLVIDYMYMFDTDHRTKSMLCSKLGISIQEQLKIDAISTVKRKQ